MYDLFEYYYYVLGGIDYLNSRLKKCEKYLLKDDRWKDITGLNHARYDATCVSISKENCIYIIGGRVQQAKLIHWAKSIEKFDAASNNWTQIRIQKPILSLNLGCSLLPHSNLILIFGGKDVDYRCQKESYLIIIQIRWLMQIQSQVILTKY